MEAIVDAIFDSFMAFVQWAIEFIETVVDAILSPVIQAIENLIGGYYSGLAASIDGAIADYSADGNLDSSAYSRFSNAWFGSLYWILFSLGAIMTVILLMLTPITAPFNFLLSFVAMAIIGFITFETFSVTQSEIDAAGSQYEECAKGLPGGSEPEPCIQYSEVLMREQVNEVQKSQIRLIGLVGALLLTSTGVAAGYLYASGLASKAFSLAKGVISLCLSLASYFTHSITLIAISIPIALVSIAQTIVFGDVFGYTYGTLAALFAVLSFSVSFGALIVSEIYG